MDNNVVRSSAWRPLDLSEAASAVRSNRLVGQSGRTPSVAGERILFVVALIAVAAGAEGASARRGAIGNAAADLVLSTPRDPVAFLADIPEVISPPVLTLTRQDAVARELLLKSRTLTDDQALRTAKALCDEAEALGQDPFLFLAVIHIESAYNHLAISPVGAEGLMQLMPATAQETAQRYELSLTSAGSFDPVVNVRLGARYLMQLQRQFQRLDYALTAYNRGPRTTRYIVNTYGKLPAEVDAFYARKVLDKYRGFVGAYGHLPAGV